MKNDIPEKIYTHLYFDLDGTLTDPKEGITKAVAYSLKKFSIDVENLDDLVSFIGPPLLESYQMFYNFSEEQALKARAHYRNYYTRTGALQNVLYEGIDSLLEELKSMGKIICVATSKPTKYATLILEHFGLTKYFNCVCGVNTAEHVHKKSDVIYRAMAKSNVPSKEKALMIGDRKFDVIGADQLGIDSLAVLYGYGSLDEFHDSPPTYIVNNLSELRDFLVTH